MNSLLDIFLKLIQNSKGKLEWSLKIYDRSPKY